MSDLVVTTGDLDIKIPNNADFYLKLTIYNNDGISLFDLTDYTAKAQYRVTYQSTTSIDFVCSIPSPELGEIIIELLEEKTKTIAQSGVWDLILEKETTKTKLVRGKALLLSGVTRDG